MPTRPATLRQPGLPAVITAEVVSTIGSQLTAIALPWFVLTTSGSPARSGLVLAAETAPVLVFGMVSGAWVERLGARRWMLLSDACRAPLVASIPALYAIGYLPFWLLLVLVFAVGSFVVPYTASQQMLLADAVGDAEAALSQATSILQGATRITLLLGPPLAGLLIALIGPRSVLYLDAASYLIVVIMIWLRGPRTARAERPERGRVLDGLQVLMRDRVLRNWSASTVLGEVAYQALFLSIPVLVFTRYHDSATTVGVLIGAFGAGALIGSLAASAVVARLPAITLSVSGKVVQAALFCWLLAVPSPVPLAILLLLLGTANGLVNGPSFAIRLSRIPIEARARALTAMSAATMLGATAGLATAGPAFEAVPYRLVFGAMALLQVFSATIYVTGARMLRREKREQLGTGATPEARPSGAGQPVGSVTVMEGDDRVE